MSEPSISPEVRALIIGPSFEEMVQNEQLDKLGKWNVGNFADNCDEEVYKENSKKQAAGLKGKLSHILHSIEDPKKKTASPGGD